MFNLTDPVEYGSLLYLAQHDRYPTSGRSPRNIAAFFAFTEFEPDETQGEVRILVFNAAAWPRDIPNAPNLVSPGPYFNVQTFTPIENPGALPQQGGCRVGASAASGCRPMRPLSKRDPAPVISAKSSPRNQLIKGLHRCRPFASTIGEITRTSTS